MKYIYLVTVLNYIFHVSLLFLSNCIFGYFPLLLYDIYRHTSVLSTLHHYIFLIHYMYAGNIRSRLLQQEQSACSRNINNGLINEEATAKTQNYVANCCIREQDTLSGCFYF